MDTTGVPVPVVEKLSPWGARGHSWSQSTEEVNPEVMAVVIDKV